MREYKLNHTKPMNEKFESIKSALIKQLPQVRNVKDFITILQKVLETLGEKPAVMAEAQPEKPAPKRDLIYEGLMKERRRANREFAWKKDGPLKDSY